MFTHSFMPDYRQFSNDIPEHLVVDDVLQKMFTESNQKILLSITFCSIPQYDNFFLLIDTKNGLVHNIEFETKKNYIITQLSVAP